MQATLALLMGCQHGRARQANWLCGYWAQERFELALWMVNESTIEDSIVYRVKRDDGIR